jgi:hypothetical protein
MDARVSTTTRAAIADSRRLAAIGKFKAALDTLTQAQLNTSDKSSGYAVQSEICRIRLILGDLVSLSFSPDIADETQQRLNVSHELMSIQIELGKISTRLELDGPLRFATSLFQKYNASLGLEDADESVVSLP